MKILISFAVVLALIIASGTNLLSGALADLIILTALTIALGPLRLIEIVFIGLRYFFSAIFKILAIAGG